MVQQVYKSNVLVCKSGGLLSKLQSTKSLLQLGNCEYQRVGYGIKIENENFFNDAFAILLDYNSTKYKQIPQVKVRVGGSHDISEKALRKN